MVRIKTYLTTNVAETSLQPHFPELAVRVYPYPEDKIHSMLKITVEQCGWELLKTDNEQYKLHAVATTPLWRFKDDVLIRIKPMPDGNNAVYIRSSSRSGKGDLGTNTRHILDFYTRLDKVMQ